MIFAAASNRGSGHELFPANHETVFSIRATNDEGTHEKSNPSLPERGESVFGTLGVEVPAWNRGNLTPREINRTGSSVATAIAAGIAAIVLGYINTQEGKRSWDNIKTYGGFQKLLYELSTVKGTQERFFSLENHFEEENREAFEQALDNASNLRKKR